MLTEITNTLLNLLDSFGYLGITFIMFLESGVFPPIPSDVILGSVGLLVHRGEMQLGFAAMAAAFGNMLGSVLLYTFGRFGGRPFVRNYGKYIYFSEKKLDTGKIWFEKYGDALIFFSQFIPVGRSIVSIPAGILQKSLIKLCLFSFLGSLIWASVVIYIASKLGDEWEKILEYLDPYSFAVLTALAIGGFIFSIYTIYSWRKEWLKEDT